MIKIDYEEGIPYVLLEAPLGLTVERVDASDDEGECHAWAVRVGVGSDREHAKTAFVLFLASDIVLKGLYGALDRMIRGTGLLDDGLDLDFVDDKNASYDG